MKIKIVITISAFIVMFSAIAGAQTGISTTCKTGKFEIGTDMHKLFYAYEIGRGIKDTLMITEIPLAVKSCRCSDTIAVFLAHDLFSANLIVFRYWAKTGWKFSHIQALPIELPHGDLSKDATYVTSSYELESDRYLTIKKIVQKVDGSNKKTEVTKYRLDIDGKALEIENISKY